MIKKTIQATYLGDLSCELRHLESNKTIRTDAPTDNQGKGENFSPTDLIAAALGSCMMTILGIRAKRLGISLQGAEFRVEKVMKSNPRKISKLKIQLKLPASVPTAHRAYLENEAKNCPVALSLSKDIRQEIEFTYSQPEI